MIKPQDILVVMSLCSGDVGLSYAERGRILGLSASETHGAVRRLGESRLVDSKTHKVAHGALCNFLIHGVPYAFPAQLQEVVMGMPTAWAAPVMKASLGDASSLPPVWPDPQSSIRGVAVRPLYSSVPKAAQGNPELYDLLALVDVLRLGQTPERRRAGEEIFKRLTAFASV